MASHKRFKRDGEPAIPYADCNRAFEETIEAYVSTRLELKHALLGSSLPKEDGRPRLNPFSATHFVVDIERAIDHSTRDDIGLRADLKRYFLQKLEAIPAENFLPERNRQQLVVRLGSEFIRRGLQPREYWRKQK